MIYNWRQIDEMIRDLQKTLQAELIVSERNLIHYKETTYSLTEFENGVEIKHEYKYKRPLSEIGSYYMITLTRQNTPKMIIEFAPSFFKKIIGNKGIKIEPTSKELSKIIDDLTNLYNQFEIRLNDDITFKTNDLPTDSEQILKTVDKLKKIKSLYLIIRASYGAQHPV